MDKLRQLVKELDVADAKGSPADKIDQIASQIGALVVDGDAAALETQAIALIQHDKFEAALEVLGRAGSNAVRQGIGLVLRDYSLYKLRRLEGPAPNHQTLDQESRALVHIHAQNHYREGDFHTAHALYNRLRDSDTDVPNEKYDLKVNLEAVKSQLSENALPVSISPAEENDAFDVIYNRGTRLLRQNRLNEAQVVLAKAETLCRASGLPQEDLDLELGSIILQSGVIARALRENERAAEVFELLKGQEHAEPMVKVLALNNSLLLDDIKNPFLAARQLFECRKMVEQSTSYFEAHSIYRYNLAVLDLLIGKHKAVKTSIKILEPIENSLALELAFNLQKCSKSKSLHTNLQQLFHASPSSIPLALALIQHSKTDLNESVRVIRKLMDALKRKHQVVPNSLLSLASHLYEQGNKPGRIPSLLVESVKKAKENPSNKMQASIKATARRYINGGKPSIAKRAVEMYRSLLADLPEDQESQAGLVAALCASGDIVSATAIADTLPSLESLSSDIDIDSTEKQGVPDIERPLQPAKQVSKKRESAGSYGVNKLRHKMPKKYDPKAKPDPERWLPKIARKDYVKKEVKNKQLATTGATQGSVEQAEKKIDTKGKSSSASMRGKKRGGRYR